MALHVIRPGRRTVAEIKAISDPVQRVLAAADYFSMPPLALPPGFVPDEALLCGRGVEFWSKAKALPLVKVAGRLTVAFADPFDLPSREEVARVAGGRVWSVVAAESEVAEALARVKAKEDAANPALALENIMRGQEADVEVSAVDAGKADEFDASLDAAGEAPVIRMVNSMMIEALKFAIDQPHGIILVTGPTGSGKTTTLYSCLQDLNKDDVNIVTAEDPVEYELAGVNQCHVNVAQGLTFAGILRSVLRQDPDIVLVGEIRDGETADIAVKAALTGHLVLSTLHTNDACGVVARLFDMGIQPFMLASSLILAQAQRLYRRLCPYCRTPVAVDRALLEANKVDPAPFEGVEVFGPGGCPKCHGTGYKGRGAVMEVLPISPRIRHIVEKGGNAEQLRAAALEEGMVTLKEAGMMKVRAGLTSLAAAFAVTGGE